MDVEDEKRDYHAETRRVKTETLLLLEFVFLRAFAPPREIMFSVSKLQMLRFSLVNP